MDYSVRKMSSGTGLTQGVHVLQPSAKDARQHRLGGRYGTMVPKKHFSWTQRNNKAKHSDGWWYGVPYLRRHHYVEPAQKPSDSSNIKMQLHWIVHAEREAKAHMWSHNNFETPCQFQTPIGRAVIYRQRARQLE